MPGTFDYDQSDKMVYDRNGRVIRTAPGAPMSGNDSMANNDPLHPNLSSELSWRNKFGGQPTGGNSITSNVLSDLTSRVGNAPISLNTPGVFTAQVPSAPQPTLQQLAQTGVNHAQQWMDAAATGANNVKKYADMSAPAYTTYDGKRPDGTIIRDKVDSVTPYRGGASSPMLPTSSRLNPTSQPVSGFKKIQGDIYPLAPVAQNNLSWGSAFA